MMTQTAQFAPTSGPITIDELRKLKEENDLLERQIMEQTKKFGYQDDDAPLKERDAPKKVNGIKVHKFNVLPQFAEEAMQDRGTPYMPIQCKKRGHDGTMFTS
jgi:hypothetical protein